MTIALFLFLVSSWSLNAAPAFNLPLVGELATLAFAMFCLACSKLDKPAFGRFWRDRSFRRAFVVAAAVVVVMVVRALSSFFAGTEWEQTCALQPGMVQKLECIFQASVDQNYALRALSSSLAALAVFACAFKISLGPARTALPVAIGSASSLFVLTSTIAWIAGAQRLLPLEIIGSEDVGHGLQMSYLMQNPTWVWPHLVPGIICLAWSLRRPLRASARLCIAGLIVLHVFVALLTQERGAILMVIALVCSSSMAAALSRKAQSQRLKLAAAVIAPTALIAIFMGGGYGWLTATMRDLDWGGRLAAVDFFQSSRFEMWRTALVGIMDRPLLGHGYASWYEEFGKLAHARGSGHLVLDTAHSYFVQTIFEGGLIALVAHLWLLGTFARVAFRQSEDPNGARFAMSMAAGGYLVVAGIQELDFVRSTFFQNALFAGWLLGGGAGRLAASRDASPAAAPWRIGLMTAGFAFALLALTTTLAFSLAGYQFEANVHHGFAPKVRWLRPRGTLTFVGSRAEPQRYAVYTTGKTVASHYEQVDPVAGGAERYDVQTDGEKLLAVRARRLLSLPDTIAAPSESIDKGRAISLMLHWPAVVTTLPLVSAAGVHAWEAAEDGNHTRWCGTTCTLRFRLCPEGVQKRRLTLAASRPDVSAADPLTVRLVQEAPGSAPLATDLTFANESERRDADFDPRLAVRIVTSRAYVPGNHDRRELGIMLVSSRCL